MELARTISLRKHDGVSRVSSEKKIPGFSLAEGYTKDLLRPIYPRIMNPHTVASGVGSIGKRVRRNEYKKKSTRRIYEDLGEDRYFWDINTGETKHAYSMMHIHVLEVQIRSFAAVPVVIGRLDIDITKSECPFFFFPSE